MLERFWREYAQIVFLHEYGTVCKRRADKIILALNLLAVVFATVGISGFVAYLSLWPLWALIILLTQILSALKAPFMIAEKSIAFKYYLAEHKSLLTCMELEWDKMNYDNNPVSDDEINELICGFKIKNESLRQRYLEIFLLSESKKLLTKADTKTDLYLERVHPTRKEQSNAYKQQTN